MAKTWTKVKHDRRFDLGRAIFFNLVATLLFAAATPASLYFILITCAHEPVVMAAAPAIPILCVVTFRFFHRFQDSIQVWREWKAFLRELDAIETVDITFEHHI